MKDKLLDILEKHYHGRNHIESRCADEILALFNSEKSEHLQFEFIRILTVVAQRWGSDYPGSTVGIVGREAIEILEKHKINWRKDVKLRCPDCGDHGRIYHQDGTVTNCPCHY